MNELRDRFRTLERLEVPDLNSEIVRRAHESTPTEPRGSRVATVGLALVVAAVAIGFLVATFQRGQRSQEIGNPEPGGVDALVQGFRVSWPESWTLVQLSGETKGGQGWPILQLANYDPGLDAAGLCPQTLSLPAHGVALYVQRDLAPLAQRYDDWPVNVDPSTVTELGCGQRPTAAWTVGGTRFQASLAFGPEATEQDREALLHVFRSLEVVEPKATDWWHHLRPDFINTWYVAWGVRADEPVLAATYLVGDDPMAKDESQSTRVLALNASGLGWGELDFRESFQGLGDSKHPDRPVVQAWGVASLDVDRVLLRADDGREYELTIGPSLDRYGVPGRPTYVEFEPPLLGEYVALGPEGKVLGRRREENWPPESATPPPTPSPQAEAQVWLSDAEARRTLEQIEAAIDGPVLLRGNNWNYPWVVYISAEGTLTYRDGDSFGEMPKSASHFEGTRYSYPPDPEILFVGVASHEVAWFGLEGEDGRSIAGTIVPVPDSELQVVSVTVLQPEPGDRLVAKDANGQILDVEPLQRAQSAS